MTTRALGKIPSCVLLAYFRGPAHPAKLRIWGWLRNAVKFRELTVPYCGRGWIALDDRDLLQRYVLADGLYEPEVWESLFQFAEATETVWDIGAHVGTFTIRSLLDPRVAAVHAFEPNPVTHAKLARNIRLNSGISAACVLHSTAVALDSVDRHLYHGTTQNTGLASLVSRPTAESSLVECASIDELVFERGVPAPTLMKIDVEGSEYDVLCGARRLLRSSPTKAIVIEAEPGPNGNPSDARLVEYLRGLNYSIRHITRPGGETEARENYLVHQ